MIFLLKEQTLLQALSGLSIGGILKAILGYIFILIDSVVYFFVSQGFKMYIALSQFKLFDNSTFKDLINRTYIIIGVVSLFIVAYALINSIINPDNASKGDKSLSKIVKNIVFAIIGIAIVPTLFDYFYYFQRVILCNNVIPKIFLAQEGYDSSSGVLDENIGPEFATYLFQSFFYPNSISEKNISEITDGTDLLKASAEEVVITGIEIFKKDESTGEFNFLKVDSYSLQEAYEATTKGESFFNAYRPFLLGDIGFKNSVANNTINYLIIISTIAGVYCAYVLANLCIDMAVRAIKLAYLELIAPLPIMTIIVPGKKGVFDTWLKKTISVAVEVFVRLFIVSFTIYLIRTIPRLFTSTAFSYSGCKTSFGLITALLIRALVYCGLLTFIKQAPKFFSEATGIKSDGFKLGIADKLGEMALIGGAAKNGVRAAQGAATGALGGLATGLGNRDKISWKKAVMQGATQGFKGKGNQFSKQRESTFQSIGEYKDKTQGIFGGESKVSKFVNDHKKDVEKDYSEKANLKKSAGTSSDRFNSTKRHFTEAEINDRNEAFKNTQEYKDAEAYAANRMMATGETSDAVRQAEINSYLTNLKANTTDKNVKRRISQYESDNLTLQKQKELKEAQEKLDKSQEKIDESRKIFEGAQQELNDARFKVAYNKDKINQTEIDSDSKLKDLNDISSKLALKQKDIDENKQLATVEKDKIDAAVASIVNIHPELKDKLTNTKSYDELKTAINDFKLKLDIEDRNAGAPILNNGRTELNQVLAAMAEYENISSKASLIKNDYETIKKQQEHLQKEYDFYKDKIKKLKEENEALGANNDFRDIWSNIREKQREYESSIATRDANEATYESNKAAYITQVNNAAELVYNGDASLSASGDDDLDMLARLLRNAIDTNNKALADELYKQMKLMEDYRGAKQGIADMGKAPDYDKQILDALKKLNKDK